MTKTIVRVVLALYPRAFRRRYGPEVRDLVEELEGAGEQSRLRLVGGLLAAAAAERLRATGRRRPVHHRACRCRCVGHDPGAAVACTHTLCDGRHGGNWRRHKSDERSAGPWSDPFHHSGQRSARPWSDRCRHTGERSPDTDQHGRRPAVDRTQDPAPTPANERPVSLDAPHQTEIAYRQSVCGPGV